MSTVTIDEIKEQVNTLESREQLKLVEYIIQQLTNNDQIFKKPLLSAPRNERNRRSVSLFLFEHTG